MTGHRPPSPAELEHAPPFDVCGPLPTGVTVLEASAGTGKTFTIAALAARYVAEGVPLEHVLLVTFTRMATGELRDRVRQRLVTSESGLARVLAGADPRDGAGPMDGGVLAVLAAGSRDEVERRRRRLAAALADFDAATIATTHGFCQHVLSGLGMAGDVERDMTFVEDVSDLVAEVVDDLYVRRFHRGGDRPIDRAEALAIGMAAVANPQAPVEPVGAARDTDWAMRVRLAWAVRDEVDRRKRRAGVLTYDDVLIRLAANLNDDVRGSAARARLAERYRVALVDEFQDTDPVQWEIMRRAFGAGSGATLVLIGDPKQAIYAFRGADVYAYLQARATAGEKRTLGVNWRSDQALVEACDALFGGATLGHPGIRYHAVQAGPGNQEPRLAGAPCGAPLRVRVVHRDDGRLPLTPKGYLQVGPARDLIAGDLAADVVALLSAGAHVLTRRPDGAEDAREPLAPGHLAVLVRTNRHAALVRDCLEAAGVPAVINGAGSVLATPAAGEWLALLEALERPASPSRARTAALTPFLGWTAAEVALAGEAAWEDVHARLHRWSAVLRRRGVAALLETVTRSEELARRLLALEDGERRLTDLRHVGQLLHEEAGPGQAGATALAAWLRQRMAEAGEDTGSEERSRRLESDAEAVQVLTIHRSKGLEFPVVYFPYLWDLTKARLEPPPVYHDPANGDVRTLHVGKGGPGFSTARRQCLEEQRGEELRLAYVALTRARHQAVVWWAASWDSRDSALGRLLFARDAGGNVAAEGPEVPADAVAVARFAQLGAAAPGRVAVERATGADGRRWVPGRKQGEA
ncbi:MAG TPA: UvrD-helicase domain-containing protein, partial [Acidimicrobiales bacterium]|nr:UvrD-helicase domain-containing protein [Acidimicrobiales bacterium]